MAKIIEFYIPQGFRKVSKWFPPDERGKVLVFPLTVRKSAWPVLKRTWRNWNWARWSNDPEQSGDFRSSCSGTFC